MKAHIKSLFLLLALIAVLAATPGLNAQTFKTLYDFTNGIDGANPVAGLILSGNRLYGTASSGGSSKEGTVFRLNTDGTDFTNLHSFTALSQITYGSNSDGSLPTGGLILSGNRLYGTAKYGGSSGDGTVFAVNTDGMDFTNLHSFIYSVNGAYPYARLLLSGNTLYGTASSGCSSGNGTVFAVNTDDMVLTPLHIFPVEHFNANFTSTNSDGALPYGGLVLSGNTLYGMASQGGTNGNGTVFSVNLDSTGFTVRHFFSATSGASFTNSDGSNPEGGLLLSSNTLYGTAIGGGANGNGTIFRLNLDGSGFTNLYNFSALVSGTNSDGIQPDGDLILSGGTLYGTADGGGSSGYGTVFRLNTDGTGFTNLYSFTAPILNRTNSDGIRPNGLILSGNTLYGTAPQGGIAGFGTVFSLSLGSSTVPSPQLAIAASGTNVILTWLTNATGFTLQSATNLVSPSVWSTNLPAPVVVNGQNTVTNPISVTRQFYRLTQ